MNPPKMTIKISKDGIQFKINALSYNFNTSGFLCIHETTDIVRYIPTSEIREIVVTRIKEVQT